MSLKEPTIEQVEREKLACIQQIADLQQVIHSLVQRVFVKDETLFYLRRGSLPAYEREMPRDWEVHDRF